MVEFKKIVITLCAGMFLAPIVAMSTTESASACGNATRYHKLDPLAVGEANPDAVVEVDHLMLADRAFRAGDWRLTIERALTAHPTLARRSRSYKKSDDLEVRRAAWLTAIATVRSNGAFELDNSTAAVKNDRKRRMQLDWATDVLVWIHEENDKTPLFSMMVAEAYARTEGKEAAAISILEKLAAEDFMPDHYGWATAANLYTRAKIGGSAARANAECEKLGGGSDLCTGDWIEVVRAPAVKGSKKRKKSK